MSKSVSLQFHLHVLLTISLVIFNGVPVQTFGSLESILDGSLFSNLTDLGKGILKFFYEFQEYHRTAAPDVTPADGQEYDFIVVGAGTAGAVIASRLSEIKDKKVLLIEAGPEENRFENIPGIALYLQLLPSINWGYKTQPSDKYCLSMNDHRCNWVRGKIMGGSSMLNLMLATRSHPEDYDDWEEMGCTGWSWKDVFPYFKKLENMSIPVLRDDKEIHNTDGPVPIQNPVYHSKGSEVFLEAAKQMGFPLVDYNDYRQGMGFALVQSTINKATRVSSNAAYIRPVRCRTNLYVSKHSMAEKILMDENEKRAVGVRFRKSSSAINVYAKDEVILCAGAIGSPQLLMLSGIGPAKHLTDKGIKVMKDIPGVGKNLMDHIAYGGLVMKLNDSISLRTIDILDPTKPNLKDYFLYGKGPLTTTGGIEAIGFMDTNNMTKLDGRPNMEVMYVGAGISSDPLNQIMLNIQPEVWAHMFDDSILDYCWSAFPMILRPKSRGYLELASDDVNDHPLIYPNYLDHPDDIKTLIQGIRAVQKLSETPAYQKYDTRLIDNIVPGCESHEFDSDDYWGCALRHIIFTVYHYSGTCKMGAPDDPTTVVTPDLKVIGIKALRVCDASAMPTLLSGHLNVPLLMMAEKLSDHIKQEYGYPTDPV